MYAPQHAPNPVLSRSLVACAVALTINDEMCTAYDAHRIHMWYFVRCTQSISIRFVVGPAASQAKDTEAPCHAQWWETALARLHPQGYRCGIHESVTLTALRVVHGGRESWKPSSGGIGVVFVAASSESRYCITFCPRTTTTTTRLCRGIVRRQPY